MMTKADVEKQLVQHLDINHDDAKDLLNVILDQITLALSRQERVALVSFGSFEVREHQARTGRNPQTGEALQIPAGRNVLFRPGKALKAAVADSAVAADA